MQRSEVRGGTEGGARGRCEGVRGERGRRWCGEQPHGRTRTNTDRHGPQAGAMVLPGTWNLVERSECRGQRSGGTEQPFGESRGQNSEVRGGIEGGARGRCEGVRGQGGL
jgi:hypothetical protein